MCTQTETASFVTAPNSSMQRRKRNFDVPKLARKAPKKSGCRFSQFVIFRSFSAISLCFGCPPLLKPAKRSTCYQVLLGLVLCGCELNLILLLLSVLCTEYTLLHTSFSRQVVWNRKQGLGGDASVRRFPTIWTHDFAVCTGFSREMDDDDEVFVLSFLTVWVFVILSWSSKYTNRVCMTTAPPSNILFSLNVARFLLVWFTCAFVVSLYGLCSAWREFSMGIARGSHCIVESPIKRWKRKLFRCCHSNGTKNEDVWYIIVSLAALFLTHPIIIYFPIFTRAFAVVFYQSNRWAENRTEPETRPHSVFCRFQIELDNSYEHELNGSGATWPSEFPKKSRPVWLCHKYKWEGDDDCGRFGNISNLMGAFSDLFWIPTLYPFL